MAKYFLVAHDSTIPFVNVSDKLHDAIPDPSQIEVIYEITRDMTPACRVEVFKVEDDNQIKAVEVWEYDWVRSSWRRSVYAYPSDNDDIDELLLRKSGS